MATKKLKLSPIEREIKTRTRRIDNARKRIAEIQLKAANEVNEIKARMEADLVVLNALRENRKK